MTEKSATPKKPAAEKKPAAAKPSKEAKPKQAAAKSATPKADAPKAARASAAPKTPKAKAENVAAGSIRIVQTGSNIGRKHDQEATLIGLGLNKLHRARVLKDSPEVRGMIEKVKHLVRIEQA
ncbi:MAG: 50S ribosomal protein L30 [Alphaproteobacteria bacterium]|nr:50S ribosomal protein L30 [Alphaproteobacteria bacterium]